MTRTICYTVLALCIILGTLNEIMIWDIQQQHAYKPIVPERSEYKNCPRVINGMKFKITTLKKSCS